MPKMKSSQLLYCLRSISGTVETVDVWKGQCGLVEDSGDISINYRK